MKEGVWGESKEEGIEKEMKEGSKERTRQKEGRKEKEKSCTSVILYCLVFTLAD